MRGSTIAAATGGLLLVTTSTLALGSQPSTGARAAAASGRITLPTRPSFCGSKRACGEPPSPLEGLLAKRGGIKIRAEPVIQPDARAKMEKKGSGGSGGGGKGGDGRGKADEIVGARVSYGSDGQRGLRMDVDVDVNELTNSLGPAAKPIVAVAKFVQQTIFFTAPVLALAGLITQIAGITCSRYTKTQADKKEKTKAKASSSSASSSSQAPQAPAKSSSGSSSKKAAASSSGGGYFDFLWRSSSRGGAFDATIMAPATRGGSAASKNVVVDWPAVGSLAGRTAAQWAWLMVAAFVLGKLTNKVTAEGLAGKAVDGRLLASVDVAAAFGAIFLSESIGFLKSKMDMNWYHKNLRKPTWTPKPIVFPLVWIPLKSLQTAALTLVWRAVGRDPLTPAVAAFVLHLCLGDLWNVTFFGERRIGAGLSVMYAFYGALAASLYAFKGVNPTAFALLLPTAVWVFIATSLNYSIHLMNGQEPMYPFKRR